MTASARRAAIQAISHRTAPPVSSDREAEDFAQWYGRNVFSPDRMRDYLPEKTHRALVACIERGTELDPTLADQVAQAMKAWALDRGATHFTHWFQPMTGLTAEKHDSFLDLEDGRVLLEFSGKQLIKGEPDASSFPSGGLRATFEARGYTAWDPTSPAFIRDTDAGATLCIPTAFCSWTGEALDKKTPLLRSGEALDKQALRMLRLLGDDSVGHVYPTVGAEQEYFLVDLALYRLRPDLIATGRTLFGARPPKGQELEDHYFGSISPRVLAYMQDVERELWKLGVPVKTRHNEVAPSQFEIAPVFERTTVSTDHNMLTMEVLRQVARRHGFECLLHEKPFAGINGSGKHNNWSLATDRGDNLLDPGQTPGENMRFIVFLTAVIQAVDTHAGLLRASIAHAGNDHRLGANEAPPAILSIYLGDELTGVVEALIAGSTHSGGAGGQSMRLGVTALPPLPRDATDRNRTSPFAFTGNKFEFRAVGSSQSIARPNVFTNTIVADALAQLADAIEAKTGAGTSLPQAVQQVVRDSLTKHHRVVFNGNGYADAWQAEAEKRGLPNLRTAVDAIGCYGSPESIALFERHAVLSRKEVESRVHVMFEAYSKALTIETQSCLGLASTSLLPAALRYQERVGKSIAAAVAAGAEQVEPQRALLKRITDLIGRALSAVDELQAAAEEVDRGVGSAEEHAFLCRDRLVPAMGAVREACDALEAVVDDELWPLPKYRELLFLH